MLGLQVPERARERPVAGGRMWGGGQVPQCTGSSLLWILFAEPRRVWAAADGTSSASVAGWSLQHTSATGTGDLGANASQLTELPDVTLAPGQYLLVQEASNAAVGDPLPAPDVTDGTPVNMGATGGKVALPQAERYTYDFEGNSQALDHILLSDSLFGRPFADDAVHVNSEFAVQASDHDPQVARITLGPLLDFTGFLPPVDGPGRTPAAS